MNEENMQNGSTPAMSPLSGDAQTGNGQAGNAYVAAQQPGDQANVMQPAPQQFDQQPTNQQPSAQQFSQTPPRRTYPWPPQDGPDPSSYCEGGYASYAPPAPEAPKKKRTWIVPLVMCIIVCVTLIICVASCSSSVSLLANTVSSSEVDTKSPTVAVINIDSTIQYDNTANSPEGLKVLLDEAASDKNIVAVVLRVDSGGGTATAGEEMATYVKQFRQQTGKPVVVSSASTNASAAYEISSQANYIFTAKSTAIGAIGTAMQLTDLSGLMTLLGIKITDITSSDSKDSTYGTRSLTEDEASYYQHQVDQICEAFVETVAEGRNMTIDQVKALANGLTYTGIDAVSNGLADEIGTLEDAEDKAAELAGVGDYYTYELYLSDNDLSSVLSSLVGAQSNSTSYGSDLVKEYANVTAIQ